MRDRAGVLALVKTLKPDVIVHTAAQPSHDRAAAVPFDDFDTNAVGTLNMLEAARQACPESPFVLMSTNKVYGDAPNRIRMKELATRWDYDDPAYADGIPETFTIDQSTHTLFGSSKFASDVMAHEYGRFFNMPHLHLRGGWASRVQTIPASELHVAFSATWSSATSRAASIRVFGYKGKAGARTTYIPLDVAAFHGGHCRRCPRERERSTTSGGGKANSTSILEAFTLAESLTRARPRSITYMEQNRIGDHICYYSDLRKMRNHFPGWDITQSLEETIRQIVESWRHRR